MRRGRSGSQRRSRISRVSRGSRRQELARLIQSFGARPQNPCETKDAKLLRGHLMYLADLLAPKGRNGKGLGDVVDADDVITNWAAECENDSELVNAHRRSSDSHCIVDRRMCAIFAELAPGVGDLSRSLAGAPAAARRTAGTRKIPATQSGIQKQMDHLKGIMENLSAKMADYKALFAKLKDAHDAATRKAPSAPAAKKARTTTAKPTAKKASASSARASEHSEHIVSSDSSDWKRDTPE